MSKGFLDIRVTVVIILWTDIDSRKMYVDLTNTKSSLQALGLHDVVKAITYQKLLLSKMCIT